MIERVAHTIEQRQLAKSTTPVLLMVSGGSDSTALAYLAFELQKRNLLGELGVLHVNHQLRGEAANEDAEFVRQLAELLGLTFFLAEVDVAAAAQDAHDNIEATARRERYAAAQKALELLCRQASAPLGEGRIFTAHTQDDRVENFYMRSIVGTGPGGFRSMRYLNGAVARPCMDVSRQDLRDYLARREAEVEAGEDKPLARDASGKLWREDATNAHTDQFRGYVRHEIVPKALERNPQLLDTLSRSMNLIADEDDMLARMAEVLASSCVRWEEGERGQVDHAAGCTLLPGFGTCPLPLQRRAVVAVLQSILGQDARIEAASVEAVTAAFEGGKPVSGYTNNIQGNLALSANKRGVLIEPMDTYRLRRKGAQA